MTAALDPAQARAIAAQVVHDVVGARRFLDAALSERLALAPRAASTALVQELAYGTLRRYHELLAAAALYLHKPLKPKDGDIHALLLIGIYQLRHMRVAPHAAVDATVSAAEALAKPWAKGLINACLRSVLREPERVAAAIDATDESRYCHPRWLIEQIAAAYPERWQAILAANNERPPMTLRVNRRVTDVEGYIALLRAAGMDATPRPLIDSAIVLAEPVPVARLPRFEDGWVSVQDAAAQWAAYLLDPPAGARVLDACVAPGGKAAHLLERTPDLELVGVDSDGDRLARVRQNFARLRLGATLLEGDAGEPEGWWDGRPFDAVLVDAPCSATGVLRRHPDIKLRRRPDDLPALTATQARILRGVWPCLRPGGKLLYATCSILPTENQLQMEAFLASHPNAKPESIRAGATDPDWQILPGEDGMDGFYYACARKA